MKKLKLDLDDLQVESFRVSESEKDAKGTVEANSWTVNYCVFSPLCVGTWQAYCNLTTGSVIYV